MNSATQAGLFFTCVVVALKAIYELILLLKQQIGAGKVTTGVYCNYPLTGACAFVSRDFHQMRKVEIVEGVADVIKPALEDQNRLLVQIRDGVRDMHPRH